VLAHGDPSGDRLPCGYDVWSLPVRAIPGRLSAGHMAKLWRDLGID